MLIDAGTGVGDLSLAELSQIDHIFVTHSHLDHVASIPFMVDTVGGMRDKPITVHATRETHRDPEEPPLQLEDLAGFHRRSRRRRRRSCATRRSSSGAPCRSRGRKHHAAAGEPRRCRRWATSSTAAAASLVFTGDTTTNDALWAIVNRIAQPEVPDHRDRVLPTAERELASCPSTCARACWPRSWRSSSATPEIYITHLKPGEIELTMQEIEECAGSCRPRMLQNNQVFEF